MVELLPPSVGLHLRAWKNYPRLHGLGASARAFCRLVPQGLNAVDVGANRGIYAYWLARRAETVYAFEPLPIASEYLRQARIRNLHVAAVALSDRRGVGTLWVPALDGEASLCAHLDARSATRTEVALARLDDFALPDIGFIKVDVEGHEQQVLVGALETIQKWRPTLFVEIEQRYHNGPIRTVFDYIVGELSYRHGYFWRQGRLFPLDQFDVERHQLRLTGEISRGYVNNFVFSDAPLG